MRGFTYLEDESWLKRAMRGLRRGLSGARAIAELPISDSQAIKVTEFLRNNFGPKITAVVARTSFPAPLLAAIACQETAYFWLSFMQALTPAQILARCVLDASGDANSDRSAFPRNTAAFRAKYGDDFSNMLIQEANETRRLRGYSPKQWVYKGYGIFQYDLQDVATDEAFFRAKKWYDIDECLARVLKELKGKFEATHDLWEAVRAYNGSGPHAEQYKNNVRHYFSVCEPIWDASQSPSV